MKPKGLFLKRVVVFLVVILLVLAGAFIIKKKKEELRKMEAPKRAPLVVEAVFAKEGTFSETWRYLGTIRAKVTADIAPRISGQIFKVLVREGDEVKKGQLLAVLDDRQIRDKINEYRARLAAARSAYQTQQGIFERDERLFEAKAISREQLDRSRALRDAARAEVSTLEASLHSEETELSYSRLVAPFDGVITVRHQDPGDLALVGKAVISMEQPSAGYYVEVRIPQAEFSKVKKGQRVFLLKDDNAEVPEILSCKILPPGIVVTRISRVHPAIGMGTLATIEADINQRPFGLPTGATVTSVVETGRLMGLRVPLRALLENVDATFVFFVDENSRVHVRKVEVLYRNGAGAILKPESIPAEARVIVGQESALLRLHEGDRVKVVSSGDKR